MIDFLYWYLFPIGSNVRKAAIVLSDIAAFFVIYIWVVHRLSTSVDQT